MQCMYHVVHNIDYKAIPNSSSMKMRLACVVHNIDYKAIPNFKFSDTFR